MKSEPIPSDVTRRANLARLADYLETVDPKGFNMETLPTCALGHAVKAGIMPARDLWAFLDGGAAAHFTNNFAETMWLFGAQWSLIDNTPKGAAARIRHLLQHGLTGVGPSQFFERPGVLTGHVGPMLSVSNVRIRPALSIA